MSVIEAEPAVKPTVTEVPLQMGAEEILAYVHERYRTGEWCWIQGDYRRGDSGKCLQQAIGDAGYHLCLSPTEVFWARREAQKATGCTSIPGWNDSPKRTFDDVLNLLERAIVGVRT